MNNFSIITPNYQPHLGVGQEYNFILGYRTWWFMGGEANSLTVGLYSLYRKAFWAQDYFKAECELRTHRAGDSRCSCGYYAYNFLKSAKKEWKRCEGLYDWFKYPMVSGLVVGWGQVNLVSDGFRAEYARAVALIEPNLPLGWISRRIYKRAFIPFLLSLSYQYKIPIIKESDIPKFIAQLKVANRVFEYKLS